MRKAKVFFKKEEAGLLVQEDDGSFKVNYLEDWLKVILPIVGIA